jgi:hypothetical protein
MMISGLALLLATCAAPLREAELPTLQFVQIESRCAEPGDVDAAEVTVEGTAILIAGGLETPDPCRHLVPTMEWVDGVLIVEIAHVSQPGSCVLCLGFVTYEARLEGVPGETTRIQVRYGERIIEDVEVTVPVNGG